jgi:hypothetical protein
MLAALLVTACTMAIDPSLAPVTRSPDVASPSPATPAPTAVATPILPTATPETDPAWVADLAGQLQCTGPVSDTGQEVPDQPGPFEPAPSPDKALDVLRLTYTSLPKGGFLPTEVVGDWARYEYRVGGRTKVVAVATDRFEGITEDVGWEVVGLRACDLSEYAAAEPPPAGATVWLDRTGARVRTDIVISMPGPEHCGWQSTVFLYMNREDQFFRDPKGVLADESMGRFKADTKLPKDATDTGYHTKRWRIFTVPAGDAVYVKTASGTVERWPRARVGVGCA